MRSNIPRLCLVIALVTACATGGSPSAATGAPPPATPSPPAHRDANVITMEDLSAPSLRSLNVLDAIRTLRPNFLSSRGTQTIPFKGSTGVVDEESGKVHASIDDSGVLPLDALTRLQVSGVVEIRLLSPAAAMQRFGSTAKQGSVISVRTMYSVVRPHEQYQARIVLAPRA